MNQIRLDWDDITLEECRNRVEQIKLNLLVQLIEQRLSPRSGYHIIVSLYNHLPITRIWYLRRLWGDDGNRLVQDVLNYPRHYRDVLFRKKGDWHEQPLFIYTRIDHSNEWRTELINPKKNPKRNQCPLPKPSSRHRRN